MQVPTDEEVAKQGFIPLRKVCVLLLIFIESVNLSLDIIWVPGL